MLELVNIFKTIVNFRNLYHRIDFEISFLTVVNISTIYGT